MRQAKRAIAGSAALLNETESSGETRNDESSDMSTVSIQRATNWSPVPHSASGQPPSTLSVRHMGSPFGPGLKLASSASSVGGFWHSPSALRPHALQRFERMPNERIINEQKSTHASARKYTT